MLNNSNMYINVNYDKQIRRIVVPPQGNKFDLEKGQR